MKNGHIFINKSVYLRLSILELNKILMYEFWCDIVKLKYGEEAKLCLWIKIIVYIKTDDIYEDIPRNVEATFDTLNYQLDRPLSKGKDKNVIRLMKDKFRLKIMTNFVRLRAKTYCYLIDDSSKNKKAKDKKSVS